MVFTILEGDQMAGVTLMVVDEGMDSGPIIAREEEPLLPRDTTEALTERLFEKGAELLVRSLPLYVQGDLVPTPQDEAQATYARKLTKEDGLLRWELPATTLERQVRAYSPWPGSYTHWRGRLMKVLEAVPAARAEAAPPGTAVLLERDSPAPVGVVTGEGVLGLVSVQLEGKRPVDVADFLQGHQGFVGASLPS